MRILSQISIICVLATSLSAGDVSHLYADDTLREWQARYAENLQWNFTNAVLPNLRPAERTRLYGVRLRFPLRAEPRAGLLAFSSVPRADPPVVIMPILSIKFFDDLCIASAWLEENNYDMGTVVDYVSMLKYLQPASFPGGQYLPPLDALQIPANALKNEDVDDLSNKLLKSALVWVLLHELGHIRYDHRGYEAISADQAQQQEEEANRFATEVMRRIGVPPIGIAHFFTVATYSWHNRADFTSDAAWDFYLENTTHPLNADRMARLATDLKKNQDAFVRSERNQRAALTAMAIAIKNVEGLVPLLADEDLQQYAKQRIFGLATQSDPLRPRRKTGGGARDPSRGD